MYFVEIYSEKLPYVWKPPAWAFFSGKLTFLDFWGHAQFQEIALLLIFDHIWSRMTVNQLRGGRGDTRGGNFGRSRELGVTARTPTV